MHIHFFLLLLFLLVLLLNRLVWWHVIGVMHDLVPKVIQLVHNFVHKGHFYSERAHLLAKRLVIRLEIVICNP